jgi:hypothetical protein
MMIYLFTAIYHSQVISSVIYQSLIYLFIYYFKKLTSIKAPSSRTEQDQARPSYQVYCISYFFVRGSLEPVLLNL